MERELLIATTNPDKLKEIAGVFEGFSITLKSLEEFPDIDIPDEIGSTFEENARQKALHYSRATRLLTMAEDSGFEVDALDGQPGIYSARFLRPNASYPERFEAIYAALRQRHIATSAARFVCALALACDGRILFETRGSVEGQLAAQPAGSNGFGYDPVFWFPPYGRTFGEVNSEEKLAVSHRGQAIRALRAHLHEHL
jgi:XTP/dITP diphosphohydrolase